MLRHKHEMGMICIQMHIILHIQVLVGQGESSPHALGAMESVATGASLFLEGSVQDTPQVRILAVVAKDPDGGSGEPIRFGVRILHSN
jgi:hypothetical protein